MGEQVELTYSSQENETVRTETLPEGALFVSPDGVLYQVVMAGSAGFRKAEPWPWLPHSRSDDLERPSAVALVPGSILARNYPVVPEGTPLPTLDRTDLLDCGQTSHYVFPDEQLAKLAAQLDEALAHRSGLGVRKGRQRWVLSDGRNAFRVYHYQIDRQGTEIDLVARFAEEEIKALSCEQGPCYWQYIPSWEDKITPWQALEPFLESAIDAVVAEVATIMLKPTASTDVEREAGVQPAAESPPKLETDVPDAETAALKTRRTPVMILSVDIGYGYTKGVGPNGLHFSFPSVIGTAEDIHFATDLIRGGEERPVKYGDWRFFYGEQAVLQSRIQSAIFDRSRVHDHTYKMLFVASLVELSKAIPDAERVRVVTGLPVEFFSDRSDVVELFEGLYRITADRVMDFAVESVFVAPQPFGSLFRELLNEQGKIANSRLEKGRIGVIDVGTFTTDFVVSDELRYVQRLSGSARTGWSKVINQVQQALSDVYRLELTPHEVDEAIQAGEVRVRGEPVSIASLVRPAVTDLETAIIARARDLWGEGVHLDTILVSGGGGPHLYDAIYDVYPHARVLDSAFWANAEGLYRLGQRPATFKKQ